MSKWSNFQSVLNEKSTKINALLEKGSIWCLEGRNHDKIRYWICDNNIDEPQDIPKEHVKKDNNDDDDSDNEHGINALFATFNNNC